ncbi:hypothetical protein GQX74_006824 [Glossina fuscipes]|nr:hypothetical protein GQX74_006824 [Glossina fuscipes]
MAYGALKPSGSTANWRFGFFSFASVIAFTALSTFVATSLQTGSCSKAMDFLCDRTWVIFEMHGLFALGIMRASEFCSPDCNASKRDLDLVNRYLRDNIILVEHNQLDTEKRSFAQALASTNYQTELNSHLTLYPIEIQ